MYVLLCASVFHLFIGALAKYGPLTTGPGTLGQLLAALNTSDPIWLYKRSYTITDHTCVYAKKISLGNYKYEFTQYYLDKNTMKSLHLYAKLSMAMGSVQGAKMTVSSKPDYTSGTDYILLHWDAENHCGILYSDGTSKEKPKPTSLGELRNALNTSEKLWLYERSFTIQGHSCLYIEKLNLESSKYNFTEAYRNGTEMISKKLSATFSPESQETGAKMTISGVSEQGRDLTWELMIWDPDRHCGVLYSEITTEDGRKTNQKCELYIAQQAVTGNLTQCLGYYSSYCATYYDDKGNKKQILYSSDCQSIPGC